MNAKLLLEAIFKFLLGLIIVGLLLFLPAGSLHYLNGWIFIGILFIPMFIAGIIMFFKNPELLKSRLNAKEKEKDQKEVVLLSALMFSVGFVIAGLNYRFNWIEMPKIIVVISIILFLAAYILYAEILRENAFLSRTIETKDNQKVVDEGLYRVIRHPMYMITIILFLTMPLILGSFISFIIFLIYPFIIVKRIKNEEIILEKELKGYKEYKQKVKYRLIPFIW